MAEAAACLAFWSSAGGNVAPRMIHFHLLQPVAPCESSSCLWLNPATPYQSTSIVFCSPSPAHLDHLKIQGKSDPGSLVRKSTFCEVSNKNCNSFMEADANHSLLLLDFKRQTSNYCTSYTCLGEEKWCLGDWMTAEKLLSCQSTVEIS